MRSTTIVEADKRSSRFTSLRSLRLTSFLACSLASIGLAACSLAPVISDQSIDYNYTVETVTNNVLVTNVLRARDQAPLIFSDLSQIRGSVTASLAAQASFPFGPANRPPSGTGVRDAAQGTLSLITNPTFDIAPSNTKQFYQGILEPVSGNVMDYLIQRGFRSDWIFHLLVSQIEIIDVNNKQETVRDTINFADPRNGFMPNAKFDQLVGSWYRNTSSAKPKVVVSSQPKNFGPPVPADAKALVEAKAAGLQANEAESRKGFIQFTDTATSLRLCVPDAENKFIGYNSVRFVPSSVVKKPDGLEAIKSNDACNGVIERADGAPPKVAPFVIYSFRLRSVEGIFDYLGFVLAQQGTKPLPFYIHEEIIPNERFSVSYRGVSYHVAEATPGDSTLIILSILNDLLNINRDANEVPTTKAVQAVGSGS